MVRLPRGSGGVREGIVGALMPVIWQDSTEVPAYPTGSEALAELWAVGDYAVVAANVSSR